MNYLYRVLVIEDDKETIDRVVNLVSPNHLDLNGNSWRIETHILYIEVVEKKGVRGEFEISNRCIESLIKLCHKKFNLIIADFGYSNNSSVYDELPLDSNGEIAPENLKGKVFTPEDLISKVRQYAKSNCSRKNKALLEQNFLRFEGELVVYSYQDKRFNRIYHTIGERGRITQNVFPKASFGEIYDIKEELYDANEKFKTDNHLFAFLKAKFINNIIQLKLRNEILVLLNKSISQPKTQIQVPDESQQRFSQVIKTLVDLNFLRSWDFLKLLLYLIFFFVPIVFVPYLAINKSDLLFFNFNIQEIMPILLIVAMGYLTIILGTAFYALLLYLEIRHSKAEERRLDWFYLPAVGALIASIVFAVKGFNDIGAPLDMQTKVEIAMQTKVENAEFYSIVIFLCLLGIDISTYLAKRYQINYNFTQNIVGENSKHISEQNFIVNQIFLIEMPVIIGIFLTSQFAASIPAEIFPRPDIKIYFSNNFIGGAIAMHIVYSQFVFVLLNSNKILNDFREKLVQRPVPTWIYLILMAIIIFSVCKFWLKLF